MTPRVAIATNLVPEYRYHVLTEVLRQSTYDLRIFVSTPLEQSDARARHELAIRRSFGVSVPRSTWHRHSQALQTEPLDLPLSLLFDLLRFRPRVIVSGDMGVRSLLCWLAARLLGARLVIWSEEIRSSARGRSKLQRWVRAFLTRRATAFLAWGQPAAAYLRDLGVDRRRLFECAQAINNEYWCGLAHALDRDQQRRELQLQGTVFLLVGRLVQRKGFGNFLRAWCRLGNRAHRDVTAVVVGEGPQAGELQRYAADNGLTDVRFVGPLPHEELARFYAAADVFVMPSLEDVWGMVVNEALCFGLPVLGSKYAGANQQLLAHAGLGIIVDPANIEEFALRLTQLAEDPPPVNRSRAWTVLSEVSLQRSSAAIVRMLDATIQPASRKPA